MDKYLEYNIVESRDEAVKYLCKDNKRIYVLKIIVSDNYHNKEIEILKKLKDIVDFVPKIVDDFLADAGEYPNLGDSSVSRKIMIYEYLEGLDLYDYTDNKILSTQSLNKIAFQILNIVHTLHKLGIFHRDIKLENFVIGSECKVYIIDFGVSRLIQDEYVMTNLIPGSMIYVSREYARLYKGMVVGKKYTKNKINAVLLSNDIYCTAVTLYTLFNDDFPYKDEIRYGDYDKLILTLCKSRYKQKIYKTRKISNPILDDVVDLCNDYSYKARILIWNSLSVYLK